MATNDFTPTGDSPRASDDSIGIKAALEAAVAEHEADEDDVDPAADAAKPETGTGDPKPDVSKDAKPEAGKPEAKKADDEKPDLDRKGKKAAKPGEQKDEVKADATKDGAKPEVTEPPSNWPAADKEMFKKQPKDAQDFLVRRHHEMEADHTRKTQELANQRKDYEVVEQIFGPERELLKKSNLTPSQVIQGWANAEIALRNGKGLDLIPNIMKSYKIDPIKLCERVLAVGGVTDVKGALERAGVAAADLVKAQPPALSPEIMRRLETVDHMAATMHAEQQQRLEIEANRVNGTLDEFKAQKNDKGELVHPHFDELLNEMSALVNQCVAAKRPVPPLEQLYQDAIFANPVVRQKWLDGREAAVRATTQAAQQAEREKAASAARAKSDKARRAGSSVTGSSGSGQAIEGKSKANGRLRDAIADAVEANTDALH